MQKDYQKNLSICKKNIQDQRKAISDLDWRVYLKETYPEWHDECFGDNRFPILGKMSKNQMWKVNIIYYPTNLEKSEIQSHKYCFRISRHSTFNSILKEFAEFITKQHLTLKLIFGEDIYEIVKNYIPNFEMTPENYFYIHKHLYENQGCYKICSRFRRQKLPEDDRLNCIRKYLDLDQNIQEINLRLRATKISTKTRQFQKSYHYGNSTQY